MLYLLLPTLLTLAIALFRGGSLRHFATFPLRGIPFLLLALALQIAVYLPGARTSVLATHYGGWLQLTAFALVAIGALHNWRLGVAVRVATLGLALNALVIAANGGYMPTNAAAMQAVRGAAQVHTIADRHQFNNTHLATSHTRLVLLSDIIPLPAPAGRGNVYSVGDVLLALGIALLAYRVARGGIAPSGRRGAEATTNPSPARA